MVANSFASELYQLYITRGVVAGLAEGAAITTTIQVSAAMVHDPTQRSNALSCVWTGAGVGAVIFSLAGREVLESGSWRTYYRMLACFGAALMVMCFFFDQGAPQPSGEEDEGKVEEMKEALEVREETDDCASERSTSSLRREPSRKNEQSTWQQLVEGFRRTKTAFQAGADLYKDRNFVLTGLAWNFYGASVWTPFVFAVSSPKECKHFLMALSFFLCRAQLGLKDILFIPFLPCFDATTNLFKFKTFQKLTWRRMRTDGTGRRNYVFRTEIFFFNQLKLSSLSLVAQLEIVLFWIER